MTSLADGITWFKRSSVRIHRDGFEIHVDPLEASDHGRADYVLITHPHYDNYSEVGVERARGNGSVLIAPASMKKQMTDADHFMRPGDMLQLDGFDVLAVPAHNVGKRFHPADSGWLGYVFSLGGLTYYHAGDTDLLESMAHVRCDVAFLPCEGSYTMGPQDAALAADTCGASLVIPIHWGEGEDAREHPRALAALRPGLIHILEPAIQ